MSVLRANRFIACLILSLFLSGCDSETAQTRQLLGKAENCDAASEACRITAEGLGVTLMLGPDVRPLIPFPVKLVFESGGAVQGNVVVDFQMPEMDMGVNRYRLQQSSATLWQGTATLPVCTVSRMDWIAIVEFSLDGQPYKLIYPFHSETN